MVCTDLYLQTCLYESRYMIFSLSNKLSFHLSECKQTRQKSLFTWNTTALQVKKKGGLERSVNVYQHRWAHRPESCSCKNLLLLQYNFVYSNWSESFKEINWVVSVKCSVRCKQGLALVRAAFVLGKDLHFLCKMEKKKSDELWVQFL